MRGRGGEPTLMGLAFYRQAVALQQRYANGKIIINTFQSNGILIDDEWASFFRAHDFLVGIRLMAMRRYTMNGASPAPGNPPIIKLNRQ